VVATDAPIDRVGAGRLATLAHDGLARAISPIHLSVDGDTVFALSTAASSDTPMSHRGVDALGAAAAAVTAAAIADAVMSADSAPDVPALCELCPSVRAR